MTPNEILEIDAQRNHPPGTLAGHLRASINDELRRGGDIVQEGDVLIMYRAIEPGVVEFHTFNADTPANLAKAVKRLAMMLKKAGAKIMQTTYKNKKISELLKSYGSGFPIDITKQNGLFTAKVRL
jgi:hypothetical protein